MNAALFALQLIGGVAVLIIIGIAIYKIWPARQAAPPIPAGAILDSTPPSHELLLRQIVDHVQQLNINSAKYHRAVIVGIEALIDAQDKALKAQREFMRQMFGGGYGEVDDEEAALREKADTMVRRYGLPYEQALEQAKAARVYEPGGNSRGSMRERV